MYGDVMDVMGVMGVMGVMDVCDQIFKYAGIFP
jgi:hypothetical protein